MGSAASTAYKLGQETSGSASVGAGIGGMASAAKGAASNRLKSASGLGAAAERGSQAAWAAGSTSTGSAAGASSAASSESTRSEEHTSELQSLMRISYAVFCLKKKHKHTTRHKPIK